MERGVDGERLARLTAEDSPISLGRAATLTLSLWAQIVEYASARLAKT